MGVDVFLLDGENRSTLAACRSLGRRGLNVAVAGPKNCITHGSQFCSQRVETPAFKSDSEFAAWIMENVTGLAPRMFLPMTDRSLGIVSSSSELFSLEELAPLPSKESLDVVQTKEKLLSVAEALSLPLPATRFVSSVDDLAGWEIYPAVLKTARGSQEERSLKPAVQYFTSGSSLKAYVEKNLVGGPWLLQQRIVGPGRGVFILAVRGEPFAIFCHERLLDKPPTGGVSVLSKSIYPSDAPVDEAVSLLRELQWTGIAMVEFKIDISDNRPYLMEINPRFWGSLQLSIACGVDFPWLLWLLHCEELDGDRAKDALDRAMGYNANHRLRWDLGTLDHLLIRLKGEGAKVFGALFRDELRLFDGSITHHETYQHDDPGPFRYELRNYLSGLFR